MYLSHALIYQLHLFFCDPNFCKSGAQISSRDRQATEMSEDSGEQAYAHPAKGGCNHSPLGGCVGGGHCIVMWSIVQGVLKSEFLRKTLLIHKYWHHVWFLKHYKNETQYIQRPDLRYQVLTSDLNAIPFFFLRLFISFLIGVWSPYSVVSICTAKLLSFVNWYLANVHQQINILKWRKI